MNKQNKPKNGEKKPRIQNHHHQKQTRNKRNSKQTKKTNQQQKKACLWDFRDWKQIHSFKK